MTEERHPEEIAALPQSDIIKEIEEQRPATPAGLLTKQEKDRLIERGVAGLYRWYLARSQAKRNWNPDLSFDWSQYKTDHSDDVSTIVEGYYAVEQYVPDYTARTIDLTRKSYGRSQFQIRWGAEEEKHADLWLNCVLFSQRRTPEWIAEYQQSLRNEEWLLPWHDVFHTLFYVVVQERATQLNYLNLAIITRGEGDNPDYANDVDPLLTSVAQTIAIDEAAHYHFFLEIGRLFLYYYPAESIEAIYDVINNFAMPGFDIIPNRPELGEALYRTGVYGPRQYTRDVLNIALKNLSVADRRKFSKGIKKSRMVPDENGNLRDTANFDFFDYDSVELAVEKAFGRVSQHEARYGKDRVDPTIFVPSGMGNSKR